MFGTKLSIVARLFLLALAAEANAAHADVLELKDGTILNGRYMGGTASSVRFESSLGVTVIETSQAVALTFTSTPASTPPSATPASTPPSATPAAPPNAPAAVAGAATTAAVIAPVAVTLPAGSTLLVRMMDGISSRNSPGSRFTTTLDSDLVVNGVLVARAGTRVYGTLRSAKQAGRAFGQSTIAIGLTEIVLPGGTQQIATSNYKDAGAKSIKKTAGGAAVGAAIGGIADGGSGAKKGAAIGATASLLKKGETVTIPPGALLEFQLTQPLTVRTP